MRRELAVPGVAQHCIETPLLGLAGKERDAHLLRRPDIGGQFRQHGDAARNMEAADAHRKAGRQEGPGEVDGAGELVRLDADEADQRPAAVLANHADDLFGSHPAICLVIGMRRMSTSVAQHLAPLASSASALRQASVLDGSAERNHWIG